MLQSANYGPQRKTNRVIQVCSQCGAVSNQRVEVCPFCETPYNPPPPPVSTTSTEEPEWRREVARRLEVYRSRRHERISPESQPALSFGDEDAPGVITTAVAPRTIARIRPTQRVEIHVSQPQLDFSVVETYRVHPAAPSLPVAELITRRLAGLLDAVAIAGVFAGFLAMFRSLGGQLGVLKVNFAIYAIIFFLIYILYFGLFTLFSGVTLGMQIRGLSVVGMDGAFPDTRQLIWRSFGYFLSGGTLLLGFLWALWDEDHLTWQDRISHTYITSAPVEEHPAD
ncbi:MAG: RDD family protein [Candidatus Acidiferrales bacterium]